MALLATSITTVLNPTPTHSIRFEADVPREVPEFLVDACTALGAKVVDNKPAPKAKQNPDTVAETKAAESKPDPVNDIAAAMRVIVDDGNPEYLTEQGRVKIDALEEMLGFRPTVKQRAAAETLLDNGEV